MAERAQRAACTQSAPLVLCLMSRHTLAKWSPRLRLDGTCHPHTQPLAQPFSRRLEYCGGSLLSQNARIFKGGIAPAKVVRARVGVGAAREELLDLAHTIG